MELILLSNRKIDVFDVFWVKNRVGTFFEPQNRCFRRILGQKSSWYLFRTAKLMFSTTFGSKIELVPLSNRKIDVFEEFRVKNRLSIENPPVGINQEYWLVMPSNIPVAIKNGQIKVHFTFEFFLLISIYKDSVNPTVAYLDAQ